jgi:hypothetical protein
MANENNFEDRTIVGFTEEVIIFGNKNRESRTKARIDSGAGISAIDQKLALYLQLGPILKNKKIKQSHGKSIRPVVSAKIDVNGKEMEAEFTIANREHMKYKVLVGRNILKKGFLIDPSKHADESSLE